MKPLLLVDGYNVIGAWNVPREEHLTIEQARERPTRSHMMMHGVEVVFTRHAESADNYIEAACDAAPKWRRVRVATSDAVEQTVTLGRGAERISSREFLIEITQTRVRMREEKVSRGDIFSRLPPHQREIFERMRRGEE